MKSFYRISIAIALTLMLGLSGCKKEETSKPIRFFLETRNPYPGTRSTSWTLPHSQMEVTTIAKPVLWEEDITNIELIQVELGLCILFEFDPAGGRSLYRMSVDQKGGRIVLVYNGRPLGTVRLQNMLRRSQLFMFMEIADEELIELVEEMRFGLNLTDPEMGGKESQSSSREDSKKQLISQ